jgi:hypothetical protein
MLSSLRVVASARDQNTSLTSCKEHKPRIRQAHPHQAAMSDLGNPRREIVVVRADNYVIGRGGCLA